MDIRQEILAYIDELPDSKLEALRLLLSVLAGESIVIETNLTDEEKGLIARGMADFKTNPGSFVPLDQVK